MSSLLSLVSVVGARPQFVKLGPVARALADRKSIEHRVVHTGQHYDDRMSAVFFDELELPRPDVDLGTGSGSHGEQTGAMLASLEKYFLAQRPDAVLVYGDTNSTLAATLAASKIHIPVAHVEAGLRSFNRAMPEEINRLVADHCSDRLYPPTPAAMHNLQKENLAERSLQSGDVMRDAVLHNRQLAHAKSRSLDEMQLVPGEFGLLTIHRPVNTTVVALKNIIADLDTLASSTLPLVFPVHPRTRALLAQIGYEGTSAIRIVEPLAYLDMLRLLEAARLVISDSGGVQKEAAFLGTPCVTLREETEWVETIELGVNCLVGQDSSALRRAFDQIMAGADPFTDQVRAELALQYGNGNAAAVIADDLVDWLADA